MYCEKCGKELLLDAVYCANCGAKINNSEPESEVNVAEAEPE